MYLVHVQKGASEAQRTHFRVCKISEFPGAYPQTPLIQSAPLFVFGLFPSKALDGPESSHWFW